MFLVIVPIINGFFFFLVTRKPNIGISTVIAVTLKVNEITYLFENYKGNCKVE